jgi:hypothetical protein
MIVQNKHKAMVHSYFPGLAIVSNKGVIKEGLSDLASMLSFVLYNLLQEAAIFNEGVLYPKNASFFYGYEHAVVMGSRQPSSRTGEQAVVFLRNT